MNNKMDQLKSKLNKGLKAYHSRDYPTAFAELSPFAEAGYPAAQACLGLMYAEGKGVPQNYKKAVELYTPASEAGILESQNDLGLMYAEGKGVPHNYKKAVELYRPAAEKGFAPAQFNLGWMYENGKGVEELDNGLAYMWYNLAAAQGYEKAKENRDKVASSLDSTQLKIAQDLSLQYFAKYSKGFVESGAKK